MSNILEVSLTCSKCSTNNNGVFNDFIILVTLN
jgi:hypothetical protein